MFFEQYSHEPYIATSRFLATTSSRTPRNEPRCLPLGATAAGPRSKSWKDHLAKNDFFVDDYTIADIALFAYTHVSHEGGFPLDEFSKIRGWIERVKSQPGFIPMS